MRRGVRQLRGRGGSCVASRRAAVAAAVGTVLAVGAGALAGCGGVSATERAGASTVPASTFTLSTGTAYATAPADPGAAVTGRPNIVFVLTDDLSMNLLRLHAARPGDAAGGDDVPQLLRHRLAVLPVAVLDLHRPVPARHATCSPTPARTAGSRRSRPTATRTRHSPSRSSRPATAPAMMGKYLNGYLPAPDRRAPATARPPGWNEWDVAG